MRIMDPCRGCDRCINSTSPFPCFGVVVFFFHFFKFLIKNLYANNVDPDQTPPHSAASDLDIYCLPMTHKKDARLIHVCIIVWRELYLALDL